MAILLPMTFRANPNVSNNQTSGLHVSNSVTNSDLVVTGQSLTNAQPMHVAVVDGSGNQVTSFIAGSGTIATAYRTSIGDQNTVITSSTAATTIVTADTTHYLDLVSLVLTNTSATGTEVQLFNDDGTTVRSVFYVPATDTRGIVFSTPFTQTAVNKTWQLKTVTSVASLKVTAQFVKNS